jgi:hypothetical protein
LLIQKYERGLPGPRFSLSDDFIAADNRADVA